jgi:catechol 2,3-dioxygenase
VLQRLAEKSYPLQGAADHYVSEAVYLADPEGNGIEVYADRPRNAWYSASGELRMGTVALDVDDLLSSLADEDEATIGLPPGTRIGHIHLHVPDLERAIRFFGETIGFDLMLRYGPSAGFLSAGGYHHHIGVNTWAGEGAPEPAAGSTGLLEYSILIPDAVGLDRIEARAVESGLEVRREDQRIELKDPAGSRVVIQSDRDD